MGLYSAGSGLPLYCKEGEKNQMTEMVRAQGGFALQQ
jgi:hypothetical protein